MLTAEQKNRLQLSGDLYSDPHFQHEGPGVVRWITGGTAPSVHVVFHHRGAEIVACCPHCLQEFGRFDADYGRMAYQQMGVIRQVGHAHLCQQDTR